MDVMNVRGKTVLVTGAGSGIGYETALAFARQGANLVICDINPDSVKTAETALRALGVDVWSYQVDVADAEAMQAFADAVHQQVPAVDILVNNAGVGLGGGFLHTTLEDWDWVLGINLRGVIYGCHFFVPKMVERGQGGHVVNVSSAAGIVATEALAAYSTSKFAVFGLSEALREELEKHDIGVSTICPGIINTPITQSARLRGRTGDPAMREKMVKFYQDRNYGPDQVAAAIVKAVHGNQSVVPVSPEAWVIYYLKRFAPWLLVRINRMLAGKMR